MKFTLPVEGQEPFEGNTIPVVTEPPVSPPPTANRWVVRGDEELAKFKYQSRTNPDNGWTGGVWTPSVMRYDKAAVPPKNDYRVDVSPMLEAIRNLNAYNEKAINYLFSDKTAIYNRTSYPKQMYITMSGNVLEEIAVEGNYLKFKTLVPSSNTAGVTAESHPQFVHTFDLVGWKKNEVTRKWETLHKPNTPQGIIRYFLVTNEGVAYIPLENVRHA